MGVLTSVVSLYVDDVVESTDGHEDPGTAQADRPGTEDDVHPSYQELRRALDDYKEARDRIAGNGGAG